MTKDTSVAKDLTPIVQSAAELAREAVTVTRTRSGPDHDVLTHDWSVAAWTQVAEADLPWIGVPEERGGSGGSLDDVYEVAKLTGRCALALPVVETGIAGRLLSGAGVAIPPGPLSLGGYAAERLTMQRHDAGWMIHGSLQRVPWGRHVEHVVALADAPEGQFVVVLPRSEAMVKPGQNLAGEPRDGLEWRGMLLAAGAVGPATPTTEFTLAGEAALCRALQIVGAIQSAVELTLDHSQTREQFGRPLARFQAVAHHLASMAGQSARADLGVTVSAALCTTRGLDTLTVARAKVLAGEAADVVAALAHQVHGGIGMTREYPLGRFTTRMWAWSHEFGSTAEWAASLGRSVSGSDADQLWPLVTDSLLTGPEGGFDDQDA